MTTFIAKDDFIYNLLKVCEFKRQFEKQETLVTVYLNIVFRQVGVGVAQPPAPFNFFRLTSSKDVGLDIGLCSISVVYMCRKFAAAMCNSLVRSFRLYVGKL